MMYNAAKSSTPARRSVLALDCEVVLVFDIPMIVRIRARVPTRCKILNKRGNFFILSGPSVLVKCQSTNEGSDVSEWTHMISSSPSVLSNKGDRPEASRA